MKKVTLYIAGDGSQFTSEVECREHERKVKAGVDAIWLETHRSINIEMQRMKSAYSPYLRTLPMLQAELLHAKNDYLTARKYGAKTAKAKRFAQLAVLQYKYYVAKEELARGIELYRKRRANLHELGKRLGFHSACHEGEEVRDVEKA